MTQRIVFTLIISVLIFLVAFEKCATKNIIKQYKQNNKENLLYWKDVYNKEHAVTEVIKYEKLVLEQKVKEQADLLKIKPKQIENSVITNTITKIEKKLIRDSFYSLDSSIIRKYKYIDNYINVFVSLSEEDADFKLIAFDTISTNQYWERKWFLGNRKYYIDISNKNPYVKTTNINAIAIKQKTPRFIIAPSINYNFIQNNISPGVSIIYYPLSLKL